MEKVQVKPYTAVFPCPVVLASAIDLKGKPNLITLAWVANICSVPPKVGVSIRSHRYSHELIRQTRQFVINIPTEELLKETDYCGVVSGKDHNKIEETGLTLIPASKVKAPLIKECPVNIECQLEQIIPLGSHDLFISEVVAVHIDRDFLGSNERPDYSRLKPISYCPEVYFSLKEEIGSYGFTRGRLG